MKLKLIFTSIVFFMLIAQPGCEKEQLAESNKVIMVLFDLSETTNNPETRKSYSESFRKVLESYKLGDAIEVGVITESSIAQHRMPIQFELPQLEDQTDNTIIQRKLKIIADRILTEKVDSLWLVADSILIKSGRKILKTDIMGSLKFSEKVLKSFDQKRKILVINSDMIEDSPNYNFDREKLNESRIEQIITQEKNRNNFPDLKNVKIYVAGAHAETTTKFNQVQSFWMKYFKEAGALIEPHRYSSMLLRFNE